MSVYYIALYPKIYMKITEETITMTTGRNSLRGLNISEEYGLIEKRGDLR